MTPQPCIAVVSGKQNAAERLGLNPNTLRFRLHKLGIVRPPSPAAIGNGGR